MKISPQLHRRRFAVSLAAVALLSLSACLSPTLPLPPPEAPDTIQSVGDGMWVIRGQATSGATVLIENLETGQVVGTADRAADGRYQLTIEAELCDRAEVYELIGRDGSERTQFLIQSSPDDCR